MNRLPALAALLMCSVAPLAIAPFLATPAFAEATANTREAVPASVYARAEAVLPQHIDELIFGLSVRPQWIGDSADFWFERHTAQGRDYVRVNPVSGQTAPLFDHDLLVSRLAAASGKPLSPQDLRLTNLNLNAQTGALEFSHDGKKWRFDPAQATLETPSEADKGKVSPDGRWRAEVRNGDLFIVSVADGSERRLTQDGATSPYATPLINLKTMAAQGTSQPETAPMVIWSPDSRRIATYRINRSAARHLSLVQSSPKDGGPPRVLDYIYPLTGDTDIPTSEGLIFEIESGQRTAMQTPPRPVLYYGGPWYEWSADSKAVFERQPDRGYGALRLNRIEADTGQAQQLTVDTSDTYVDFYGHFWTYDDKSGTHFWSADPDGFAHIYAINAQTGARRQLTSGNWRARTVAGTDHKAGRVLIVGSGREDGRDPYLRHLYSVPSNGGQIRLLTPEPMDHDVSVSPDGRFFVDNMSTIDQPTRSVLRRSSDGRIVMELGRADISAYLAAGYRLPEPFQTVAADGVTPIYGAIFKPADFDPAKRYPVIEDIYTGPHYVMTPKSFEAAMTGRNANAVAQIGVIAVTIDGRGTWGRSRAFQQVAYKNLHAVGLDDHIAGIRDVASRNPWMDTSHVGIYGFSAGGYDVVRAMTRRPDFYKVGVTASGNHDNRLDKATWNEQWMGTELGPLYDENSNITWAPKLEGRLMVAHGELDENVPPLASLRLADALIKANKDFEFMMVPNADHFLDAVPYYQRRRWDFFVRELLHQTPPDAYPMRPFD
ncbi:S9 family peptidase [Brevundimonas terrae]|uniref:S9 family peptidase n=1 Tax=Brevundimonas terrae TaxID=363631 RepID=A0ABP3ID77_9CAUL|nr:DPP IV N-terminal domain-containing protein [Brevundimonas terrae]NIJ26960.1 dipeptidyl aminopeptidase/acylaminoacyl peptidase [Brevundimonas terrae]